MVRAVACSLVALGLFLYLLSQATPTLNWQFGTLAGISVLLELLAVPQKRFGLFSTSFSGNFASALIPSVGPSAAALVTVTGITLRTLFKGAIRGQTEDWPTRWREALIDLNAQLVPLAYLQWQDSHDAAASLVALSLHWPLVLLLPAWLAKELPDFALDEWREVIWLTGSLHLSSGFLGVALALAFNHGQAEGFWLLPVLFILQRSARTEALRLEGIDAERLQAREEKARLELALTQHHLQGKVSELTFLEECASSLARSRGLDQAVEVILSHLQRLSQGHSVALWLNQGEDLRLVSPDAQKFADINPPLLLSCTKSGQPTTLQQGHEKCSIWPLQGEGLAGVRGPSLTQEEEMLLRLLIRQAALGLQSAHRYEDQHASLQELAQANEQMRLWLDRLVVLLDGARALSATLESSVLLERFSQLMESLCGAGAVMLDDQLGVSWGLPGPAPFLRELAENFPADQMLAVRVVGEGSVMMVRLADEGGQFGFLVLVGQPIDFSTGMQRVVQILCYHLASALRGADYHAQVTQTLVELRQTQAQLVQSSKMAAMGQFAAGVAHEINSPLAAITIALETAETRVQDPQSTLRRLALARKAVDKATAIIRKLLYYSREGSQSNQLTPIARIVRDTLEIFGPQLENAGVSLEYQPSADPLVSVNENEIQQVLINLMLNARDATTGQAERKVVIRTLQEGERAVIEVEDNGPGIAPEIQSRIFEPFFTTKDIGEGTGLGLSVSYQIAHNHEGDLVLASSSEQGTLFRLRLPVASRQ